MLRKQLYTNSPEASDGRAAFSVSRLWASISQPSRAVAEASLAAPCPSFWALDKHCLLVGSQLPCMGSWGICPPRAGLRVRLCRGLLRVLQMDVAPTRPGSLLGGRARAWSREVGSAGALAQIPPGQSTCWAGNASSVSLWGLLCPGTAGRGAPWKSDPGQGPASVIVMVDLSSDCQAAVSAAPERSPGEVTSTLESRCEVGPHLLVSPQMCLEGAGGPRQGARTRV